MSIKPKILCPPDYTILSLRFTECKKLGVVKGTQTLLQTDLSNFFIPLTNFSEKKFTVKAGKTKKLEIGDLASYWDLKESYGFIYNDEGVANGTTHRFSVYDETGEELLAQVNFTVDAGDPPRPTFLLTLAYVISINKPMSDLITLTSGTAASQFSVAANTAGIRYKYLMEYDISGFGGSNPAPYLHPGTLITKNVKYPEGRVRAIYLYAEYARADGSTCTCGCVDNSGDLLSNVKNFKWVWDSDYSRKQKTEYNTGIVVNAQPELNSLQNNANGTQTFQWLDSGNPAAYRLSVGDLITLNTTAGNPYAYITAIDGYNITVDRQGFGSGTGSDQLIKKYAPLPIEWKTAGEMLFISGGQDVYDTDFLYTETLWINNPQGYDIPFTAIIIS